MKYRKTRENEWINLSINETFNTERYRNIHGKSFNFLDKKETFLDGEFGVEYVNNFLDRLKVKKPKKMVLSDEVVFSSHKNKIKGKKVLIVGGGPSSNVVDWEGKYEYFFTSNNFYKKYEDQEPYMITFTPYIDLSSSELLEYLSSTNSYIGFEPEFLKQNEIEMLKQFYPLFKDRVVIHQTRYSSAIGVSARQAVLSILLGASEVHLCGMDLYKDSNSKNHSFEDLKELPRWRKQYGLEFQNRQVIAFWEYLSKLSIEKDCKIKNIAEDVDYNCMSFITKKGMIR